MQGGITLIALVVTIVVLIILATVSINAVFGDNGLIRQAEEARDHQANAVASDEEAMARLEQEYANVIATEPEENEGTGGGNTGTTGSASAVAEAPATYYGKTITGYSGYGKETSGYEWQIYYSDGNNIYITTTDYILTTDCPNGKSGSAPYNNGDYQPSWDNIISDYAGSSDITDTRLTKWLSYLSSDYGTSTYNNMKATAYLLDTSVWNTNFKGDKAEYAIGGPTLDMFVASYKDTHAEKYVELNSSTYGYQVKWNTDSSYANYISGLTADELNGLYIKSDTSKASYQWLASPSANSVSNMMVLYYGGRVYYYYYANGLTGVRPLVCLSSDVVLEANGDGYVIK